MRKLIIALSTTALFATAIMIGCGGGSKTDTDDMAKAKPDLSTIPPDFQVAKLGCVGYQSCIITCLNAQGTFSACEQMCDPLTKSGVASSTQKNTQANEFFAWYDCGQMYCAGTGGESDAGTVISTPACALNSDMSEYVDAPGQPAGSCDNCLENSLAAVFLSMCTISSNPDCNPAMCNSEAAACAADTP
jgi:hypothetical protein